MFNLKNKTAVITGASRGIGKCIASAFKDAGITVMGVSRDTSQIQQGIRGYSCDISDGESVNNMIEEVWKTMGRIDILVNNAGVTKDTLLARMTEEQWDDVMNVNLKGAFNCTRHIIKPMLRQKFGRIINIGSVVGIMGNPGQANYVASKAGLMGLTKTSARELAKRNITVNCIAPGYIQTDMTDILSEKVKSQMKNSIPMGRFGTPEDVASLALFLASNESGYITGQTITVDGGMVMN
jgi:3-oxoacyl-[acyl-carrier protein] reductase